MLENQFRDELPARFSRTCVKLLSIEVAKVVYPNYVLNLSNYASDVEYFIGQGCQQPCQVV